VAAQAGLTLIAGANASQSVYDVVADIGDTWRITFDSAAKTFAIKVIDTQFGLTDRSGSYTSTTDGNITTYTGTDLQLSVDARTRLLSGSIKLGGKSTTVSGTAYAVGDVAKLAGSYTFLGAMRNASNGGSPFNPKGVLKVNADGSAQMCNNGVFNAQGVCTAVAGLGEFDSANLTLVKDTTRGVLVARQGQVDFGIVHVHAGDRGLALFVDRYGRNQENVLRVGTLVAAKAVKVGAEIDGSYSCADQGGATGKITIAGTTATVTNNSTGKSHNESVTLNKASTGTQAVDFDGIAVLKDPQDAQSDYSMFMPVSSSMAIEYSTDKPYLTVCVKK
jgi:hypothetical protein